jgi:lysophospholipase L1-like esterase
MVKPPRRRRIYFFIGLLVLLAAVPAILLIRPSLLTTILQPWKDWGLVSYYQNANTKLTTSPEVVFFGDSEIQLWKTANDFPGKPYINRGIGGQTTEQLLLRFRADVIALKPKVVIILGGTNDLLVNFRKLPFERTVDNYSSMAELANANKIKVIFAAVPPVNGLHFPNWAKRIDSPDRIPQLNQWLRNYCAAHGYGFIDDYKLLADEKGMLKAELTEDGLHPNDAGYQLIVPLTEAAIRLSQSQPSGQ